jgi:hypothetical protein
MMSFEEEIYKNHTDEDIHNRIANRMSSLSLKRRHKNPFFVVERNPTRRLVIHVGAKHRGAQ